MTTVFHLNFSIAPVQAFVAQARRTRDLWVGSWLLSYLAETALIAAEKAGGRAIIPHRSQPTALTSIRGPVGGMPNRFELRFEGENAAEAARRAARAAEEAFRNAWQRIASAVFDKYVRPIVGSGNGTETIWQRQVENFWELTWVVGRPESASGTIGHLAALRKQFRNVPATEEPGTKCSLMHTLQEISGHFGKRNWENQRRFWSEMRKHVGSLDLGETERLCAIALIKRLFPRVIDKAIGEQIDKRLREQVGWPSTAFLAALPWLRRLNERAKQRAQGYQRVAEEAGYHKSEWQAASEARVGWAVVDAPIWFASAVRNDEPGQERLGPRPSREDKRQRDEQVRHLLEQLRGVYRTAAGDPSGPDERHPVPFYALLLMDGDSMGRLLAQLASPQDLSGCLGQFAAGVDEIVSGCGGRTVYAGGDDVLALLPAEAALDAAKELREAYRKAFEKTDAKDIATISAAVVYAHWRYPLRQVVRLAHHLLDEVAKERTGRDAVALGLVLSGGLNAVWSVPWAVFYGQAHGSRDLGTMIDRFGIEEEDESAEPRFNASFLYLLRNGFSRLLDETVERPGRFAAYQVKDPEKELLRDVAHAEYRRRMNKAARQRTGPEQTLGVIEGLMSLSRRWTRSPDGTVTCAPNTFSFDGWRIARFLKQVKEGKVEEHD